MENSQKPQQKGMMALAGIAVVLVLAALGLVTAYYFQSERVVDLEHQVTDLKASAAKMDKEMAMDAHGAAEPATQAQYREIPELGVKYKITEATRELTYFYRSFVLRSGSEARSVDFSTLAITSEKNSKGDYPCQSDMAPTGSVTRYVDGDFMVAGARVKDIGKKIGEFYYVYAHPQYACSLENSNESTVSGLQAGIDAVKAAYDSLEAI